MRSYEREPASRVFQQTKIDKKMKLFKKLAAVMAILFTTALTLQAAEPALDGYCPVCYISAGKAVKGTKEFSADHGGKTYYFVSQDALTAFKKSPDKFLPQYDGWCAYGMTFGKKIPVDPTVFDVVDGKLYLNKDAKIGKKFEKHEAKYIAKADKEWAKLK